MLLHSTTLHNIWHMANIWHMTNIWQMAAITNFVSCNTRITIDALRLFFFLNDLHRYNIISMDLQNH